MANGWSIVIGAIFVGIFCAISWFASPKGDTQAVWRSSLILSACACYLMWAITFFAQWHPLIKPARSNLRADYN